LLEASVVGAGLTGGVRGAEESGTRTREGSAKAADIEAGEVEFVRRIATLVAGGGITGLGGM
jgi:hypothetical protein